MSQEKYEAYVSQFSADQWRSGENQRGETFHLWLKELSEKYTLHIGVIRQLFETAKKHYSKENKIIESNLHVKDYIKITRIVENYLEEELKEIRRQKKRINQRREIISVLKLIIISLLFIFLFFFFGSVFLSWRKS